MSEQSETGNFSVKSACQSDVLNVQGVAAILGCSVPRAVALINGKVEGFPAIPHIRLGRSAVVRREALLAWIRGNEKPARRMSRRGLIGKAMGVLAGYGLGVSQSIVGNLLTPQRHESLPASTRSVLAILESISVQTRIGMQVEVEIIPGPPRRKVGASMTPVPLRRAVWESRTHPRSTSQAMTKHLQWARRRHPFAAPQFLAGIADYA